MMKLAHPSIAGLNVSRETMAALNALEALVLRWNPAINLVGKATVSQIWSRHIADSAQLFPLCPPTARSWADLGSGGGFPGLVVAILAADLKPDLAVTLVESDIRKATFLRQACRELGLKVAVVSERIESIEPLNADVVSARALAPLRNLLEFAYTHLAPQGIAIFPKGSRHADEVADARAAWAFEVDTHASMSEAEAAILVIRNIHRAHD